MTIRTINGAVSVSPPIAVDDIATAGAPALRSPFARLPKSVVTHCRSDGTGSCGGRDPHRDQVRRPHCVRRGTTHHQWRAHAELPAGDVAQQGMDGQATDGGLS
jgi:hypothetical protein